MKHTMNGLDSARAVATTPTREPRYQIYRQAGAGNFMPEFKTDSAREAVEMFAIMTPAFEGGAIRLWDHSGQHVSASVEWRPEKTDFGFIVYHRTNLFHDRLLGLIARQVQERETMRESLRQEAVMSLAV
jgi:hypothetical protein